MECRLARFNPVTGEPGPGGPGGTVARSPNQPREAGMISLPDFLLATAAEFACRLVGGPVGYDKPAETAEMSAARDRPVESITRSCV